MKSSYFVCAAVVQRGIARNIVKGPFDTRNDAVQWAHSLQGMLVFTISEHVASAD